MFLSGLRLVAASYAGAFLSLIPGFGFVAGSASAGTSPNFVALGAAVQDDQSRVDARLERGKELAATGHVEPETLLHHPWLDTCAGERFRREFHA